ncbi:SDR family oxidoreductase [Pseudomonadota bacterium]
MNVKGKRVLVTGATGGIGRHIASELARQDAIVTLVGRNIEALNQLKETLMTTTSAEVHAISADISSSSDHQQLLANVRKTMGGVDLLINNAGVVDFHDFSQQDPAMIEQIYQTNLIAPVQLTRELLPDMIQQGHGRIVNIGSTFGSIGFAYFAAYSSSKFALRGFSESLRRELNGTGVGISYIAPRAVKTNANSQAVYEMAKATNMQMDSPEEIASFVMQCIQKDKDLAYYGWPEKLFVRINALFPKLVDGALRKQNQIMARFAPKS